MATGVSAPQISKLVPLVSQAFAMLAGYQESSALLNAASGAAALLENGEKLRIVVMVQRPARMPRAGHTLGRPGSSETQTGSTRGKREAIRILLQNYDIHRWREKERAAWLHSMTTAFLR